MTEGSLTFGKVQYEQQVENMLMLQLTLGHSVPTNNSLSIETEQAS